MVKSERQWKKLKPLPLPKPSSAAAASGVEIVSIPPEKIVPHPAEGTILKEIADDASRDKKVRLNIPPRRMWGCDVGGGYCGECSFQIALLYFGNYCSEERIRYLANNEELKIGMHDEMVAKKLHLESESRVEEGEGMLSWAAGKLVEGSIVIAGWVGFLAGKDHKDEYDHIMPLVGAQIDQGDHSIQAVYYLDLYYNRVSCVTRSDDADNAQGPLLTSNKEAVAARLELQRRLSDGELSAAHDADDTEESEKEEVGYNTDTDASVHSGRFDPRKDADFYSFPAHQAYAVAICGLADGPSYRSVLRISSWEEPDWGAENEKHRRPTVFMASLDVLGLDAGRSYAVLRFDDLKDVPTDGTFFECKRWTRCMNFTAPSAAVTLKDFDEFPSDGTIFYRVVDSKTA